MWKWVGEEWQKWGGLDRDHHMVLTFSFASLPGLYNPGMGFENFSS